MSEATETFIPPTGGPSAPTVTVETLPGAVVTTPPATDSAPKTEGKPAESQEKVETDGGAVEEPKAPEDPKFSAKLAALARKGREVQQQHFALQEKEAALVSKEKEVSEKYADVEAFIALKEQAHQNPDEILKALGLSYEQITQWYINDRKPTAEMQVEQMRKAWEAEREAQAAKEAAALKQQEEQRAAWEAQETQRQIHGAIQTVHAEIASAPTEFPLVLKTNNQMEVWNLMALWMKNHNEVLPPKRAAAMIESTLREQFAQDTQALLPTLAELGLVPGYAPPAPAAAPPARASRTLSNDQVSAAPTPVERAPLPPREQEMEQALALLRGSRR
jgi:enamine deaminase RidA (YjgF/YER057c/UK114 family)